MTERPPLLVSAGEASGDRIAALTLDALGDSVRAFGMGGAGCRKAGMEVLVPLTDVAIMGWLPVARRLHALHRAFRGLQHAASSRRARLALLVGFTSFNQALGRHLRKNGVRVLWCVAPQVWAWRPSRLQSLRHSADRLAVILPFEQSLWREHGYDAHYVGHPAVEVTRWRAASTDDGRRCLAVLTGSRDQEVRATARPLLAAARAWCDRHPSWRAEVLVASSLSSRTEGFLKRSARSLGLDHKLADPVWGAAGVMHDYEIALCASGTASLEAALAGVPPIIGYRCDPMTAFVARRLILTDHIGLPNVLLGERAFPELVQGELQVNRIVATLQKLHDDLPKHRDACRRVRTLLQLEDGRKFGERIAELLDGS